MNIRDEIVRIFEENGIDVSNEQELADIDSIIYVSIVVEIEKIMEIVLPDHVLAQNEFTDFDAFVSIVVDVYDHRNDENQSTNAETTILYENR